MKTAVKSLIYRLRFPLDLIFAIFSVPAAVVLMAYRKIGSAKLRLTTRVLKRIGVFPLRNHYYEPLFDDRHLRFPLSNDRKLPGLDLNEDGQLALLARLHHTPEFESLDLVTRTSDPTKFHMHNDSFMSGDAEFLYQFIRTLKPRKIIEVGSGHSTKLAKLALDRNNSETHGAAVHVCIEPYEMDWLEKLGMKVIRKRVEDCDIDWQTELQAGDLLFIDSSHIIRPQGDVLTEYLEIIPQLPSGVYVHVHDIFTPKDYLQSWVVDDVLMWNEQYILEALLSNSARYEVVAGLNFLKHHHFNALKRCCPYLTPEREPGSFYFKVR